MSKFKTYETLKINTNYFEEYNYNFSFDIIN